MSYRYLVVYNTTLNGENSELLARWVAAALRDQASEPGFPVPPPVDGVLEDIACMLGVSTGSVDQREGHHYVDGEAVPPDPRWDIRVVGTVHDSLAAAVYLFPALLAAHCDRNGTIGACWTDLADPDPSIFLVQDGDLFVASRNGQPTHIRGSDGPEHVWRFETDSTTLGELHTLGVADAEALLERADATGQPVLARYLFGRSVRRALDDLDLNGVNSVQASELGAAAVLKIIDVGGDPIIVADTPGWQLQEVHRRDRTGRIQPRPSGRPILDVATAPDDTAGSVLDAGLRPFQVGDLIEVRHPMRLVAIGPDHWFEDSRGRRAMGVHRLNVEVPIGARLRLTKVFPVGHGIAEPVEGDLFAWVVSPDQPTDQSSEPIAPAEAYELQFIHPGDESGSYVRVGSGPGQSPDL